MKTNKVIIIMAMIFPAIAFATGSPSNNNGPRNGGNSTSNSAAISGAASSSKSESRAASRSKSKSEAEATGGNANAKGGSATSSSGGNTITVNGSGNPGNTHYSGGYEIRNTPDVFAPSALTTSPCRNGVSGGVAGSGFGLSFGGSGKDVACDLRQLAILYNGLGEKAKAVQVADGALAIECGDSDTAKALGNLCQEKPREEKPGPSGTLF